MREVRGLSEYGKWEEERIGGRHNGDNNAMTMPDDDAALLLPSQLPLPSPSQSPSLWTLLSPLPLPLPSPLLLPWT